MWWAAPKKNIKIILKQHRRKLSSSENTHRNNGHNFINTKVKNLDEEVSNAPRHTWRTC